MNSPLELIIMALLLTDLILLSVGRISSAVAMSALQGLLLGLYGIFAQWEEITPRIIVIASVSLILKGIVFPRLLRNAIRETGIRREHNPFISYTLSGAAGIILLFASLYIGSRISLSAAPLHPYSVPASFMTLFTGILLIISRRTALMQCIGYIVCENGIYMFGMAAAGEIPALVELGLLLDALVAVFVMSIAIHHIHREFDHLDTDALRSLKG